MNPIDDVTTEAHHGNEPDGNLDPNSTATQAEVVGDPAKVDIVSDVSPRMAHAETMWLAGVRSLIVLVVVGAIFAYVAFGSVLARNVTFNMSQAIDPGAANGIRRFRRETIMDVWQTMWDRAPGFGSIDLTRGILLVSTVAFFAAFVMIVTLVFVPSRREWATGLSDGQQSDTISGE